MAWPMHIHRYHHQVDRVMDPYRWERPPQVEDGQTARVHAPRATALLARQALAEADPSPEPTA